MTTIVGIVSFDGSPVEEPLLRRIAPIGSQVRTERNVCFAKAPLRTSEGRAQAHLGDNHLWIAADARIDAREELLAAFDPSQRAALADAADEDLILAAYRRWGERCAEYLRGDFSFAIWDTTQRAVFCARDPFGVKPFFYAADDKRVIFSNVLACVLQFPGVSGGLDDLSIADFLLFEHNQRPASTVFAGINRLEAAHVWCRRQQATRTSRYWSLPENVTLRYARKGEYVEQFREVLGRAVSDRITTRRAAVMMSGGLDSTSIAATAIACRAKSDLELRAYATVHDTLIPDEERHFSGIAAKGLGIPIEYGAADGYALYERFDQLGHYFPEPGNEPHAAQTVDLAHRAAKHARIALTGWDGDALLCESPRSYFNWLACRGNWLRASAVATRYAAQRPSSIWRQFRGFVQTRATSYSPPFPSWVRSDLAQRLGLRERWASIHAQPRLAQPLRPYAYHVLRYIAQRSNFFDTYHPGWTGAAIEFRHPLLDLRVVDFCLSVPPFPWCHRKELLRRAMAGTLPDAILRRPKTPLAGFPYMKLLARPESRWIDEFVACPATERYVDRSQLPPARGQNDPDLTWQLLRPLGLDLWLRQQSGVQHLRKEIEHEFA